MDYGQIERQTFKTYLAFSGLVLFLLLASFAYVFSSTYRISEITYSEQQNLDYSSINKLLGTSIWLVNNQFSDEFYTDNPTVEKLVLIRKMPSTLAIDITLSEEIAYINDARQNPPQSFILYKNLHQMASSSKLDLMAVSITNGPVPAGFFEEVATFVLTLKKYPISLSNVSLNYDGKEVTVTHFETLINLGGPIDLARKGTLAGYYISELPCEGEIRIVYTEDGASLKGIKNCE